MKIFLGYQLSGKFWGCTRQLDLTMGLAKPIFKPFPRNELEKVKFPSFILKPSVVLIVGTSGFLAGTTLLQSRSLETAGSRRLIF